MTSFAVLMDVSRREVGHEGSLGTVGGARALPFLMPGPLPPTLQNGEILPLKTLTYVALGVTLAALLLTFLFLTLLRALRSNQHGIRRNLTAALGLAQLVFLLGINQADLPVRHPSSQQSSPTSHPLRCPGDPFPDLTSIPAPATLTNREPSPASGPLLCVHPSAPASWSSLLLAQAFPKIDPNLRRPLVSNLSSSSVLAVPWSLTRSPGPQFACTVIAILLHFLYLCTFSWALLEALHLYRALTEVRDVNAGPMRFYYMLGWGVPAFITGTPSLSCPGSFPSPSHTHTQPGS